MVLPFEQEPAWSPCHPLRPGRAGAVALSLAKWGGDVGSCTASWPYHSLAAPVRNGDSTDAGIRHSVGEFIIPRGFHPRAAGGSSVKRLFESIVSTQSVDER